MTLDPQWDFDALASGTTRTAEENTANPAVTNALMTSILTNSVGEPPVPEAPEDPHVDLPGGLLWQGAVLRTARVRELTGEDEEALAAVTGSVARWMSVMLERSVERLGDEEPTPGMIRKLLIGDRDELLLAVRIATFGPEITVRQMVCPHCEQSFDATVDLSTVERVRLKTPLSEYEVPLRRGGVVFVRFPDGTAQEATFTNDATTSAQRNSRLLGHCLVRVTDPTGVAVPKAGEALAQSLSMADRQLVLKYLADHQPGPRLDDIRFTHDQCGEEVRLPLTLPELFRI